MLTKKKLRNTLKPQNLLKTRRKIFQENSN